MLVPNQSILFPRWPEMTCRLFAEIGPIDKEWDTQSLLGVLSAILSFCCTDEGFRWGGLNFVIGRCPHGTPNKTGDSYWTPFKLVALTCFVGFQEPNLKAKRTPSMRIRHIQSLSSTRRSISTLTAIKYWFYRHCRDYACLTTTTWCKSVWLGTQYHNFMKYLHRM